MRQLPLLTSESNISGGEVGHEGFRLTLTTVLAMSLGQGASIATANSNIEGEEIRAFNFGYEGAPQGPREAGAR